MEKENYFPNNYFYAVQLSDTEHRLWIHEVKSGLFFHWKGISVHSGMEDYEIKSIVAKEFSSYGDFQLLKITNSVINCLHINKGDVIYGVEGTRVLRKAGVITKVIRRTEPDLKVGIYITWDNGMEESVMNEDLFDPEREIQLVDDGTKQKIINFFTPPADDYKIQDRDFIKSKGGVVSSKRENNSAPDFLNGDEPGDGSIRNFQLEPEDNDEGGLVSLFYGTCRNLLGGSDFNKYYGNELGELRLGRCEVSIPKTHVEGVMDRPKFYKLEFRENADKHIVIKNIYETEEDLFYKLINAELKDEEKKSALIFIHGYNNSFADAARRAAQIAWDIPFDGVTGFFSWPSRDQFIAYLKDDTVIGNCRRQFEEFIEKIVNNTGIEKIHFVAHSMGNKLLTITLKSLIEKADFKEKLGIIENIVLGAPDLDQVNFREDILPKLKSIGARRTLYSSAADRIIGISDFIRLGLTRLGEGGEKVFVNADLDTIDASNVNAAGLFEHGYIFNAKPLLYDLHMLLNLGVPPDNRRLKEKEKDKLKYWMFPE